MKSERRHELQENALSAEIGKTVGFFKANGNYIAGFILLAALVVLIVVYVRGQASNREVALRAQYESRNSSALTPDEQVELLEQLSVQRDDEGIAAMATIDLGDLYARRMLMAGPNEDPAQWTELGDKAAGYYRSVRVTFSADSLAVAKAHLGLARLAENRGDFDQAKAEYETVKDMSDLQGQPVAMLAAAGASRLEQMGEPVRMATTAPAEPEPETVPVAPADE